jgi:hypothetical protein
MIEDRQITVQDVYNVVREHMVSLDALWPDSDRHGPRKVHIVELIDSIKLKLIQRAEKNSNRYESPFETAAKKITGEKGIPETGIMDNGKTEMQIKLDEARARIAKSSAK